MSQQQSIQQQQNKQQQSIAPQQSIQPNLNGKLKAEVPDSEVVPRAKRRQFTAEYKLRILREVDRCQEPGQVGALLRREGLYSSHLTRWRQLRDQGQLQALGSQKRGRKPAPQTEQVAQLRQENQRLRAQLEQAELIIEVQKKLSQLLGLMSETESGELS
jgi:transposase-like protein